MGIWRKVAHMPIWYFKQPFSVKMNVTLGNVTELKNFMLTRWQCQLVCLTVIRIQLPGAALEMYS